MPDTTEKGPLQDQPQLPVPPPDSYVTNYKVTYDCDFITVDDLAVQYTTISELCDGF